MADHIQVQDIVPRIQYTADGINKAFETPFIIFNEGALDVYLNEEKVTEGYTIQLDNEMRGQVIFNEAPQSGTLITLTRHLTIARTSDFQDGGSLRANTLNYELDYQMACLQELADNINRSMVLPPYAINSDAQLTLPLPDPGKAIIWTADGKSLENSTVNINTVSSELDAKVAQSSQNATAAQNSAQVATQMAQVAQSQAGIAEQKAQVATQKAQEASAALVGKTNVDMDNLTTDGKKTIINLGMPDYSNGVSVTTTSYTATEPCFVSCDSWNKSVYINGTVCIGCGSNTVNVQVYLDTGDVLSGYGTPLLVFPLKGKS